MAISTIPLSRTLTVTSQFIRNAPLQNANNDPGFTNADWVRQMILSPPFGWRWNRGTVGFTCVVGKTDYVVAAPNFGWAEKAGFTDPNDGNRAYELEIVLDVAKDATPNLITQISPWSEDASGNVTFRVFPAPAAAYPVTVDYQQAASVFQTSADTWGPIPDWFSYIYNQGMLAKAYEYIADERYVPAMQLFFQLLTSTDNGLSESQRSIFLSDRLNMIRQNIGTQASARK